MSLSVKYSAPVFYVGDFVRGTVELDVEKPISTRCVSLVIKGKARGFIPGTSPREPGCEDTHKFMQYHCNLFGSSNPEEPPSTIEAGHYSFPFSCFLVPNLPNTYATPGVPGNAASGSVWYSARAILDVPHGVDKTEKVTFTVARGLKSLPPSEPINDRAEHEFMFFGGRPVEIKGTISESIVCPGHNLTIHVEINNRSSRTLSSVKCKFNEEVLVHVEGLTRLNKDYKKVLTVHGELKPGQSISKTVEIEVPETAPSLETKFFKVFHMVKICCDVRLALEPKIKIPVQVVTLAPPEALEASPVSESSRRYSANRKSSSFDPGRHASQGFMFLDVASYSGATSVPSSPSSPSEDATGASSHARSKTFSPSAQPRLYQKRLSMSGL